MTRENDDGAIDEPHTERVSTGVPGADTVLDGGLVSGRSYLVRGEPGVGKTLLGLHFLSAPPVIEGEERALYINLGEPASDIRQDARGFGFDTDHIEFLDLSPSSEFFRENQTYDIFPSGEVEGQGVAANITEEVQSLEPTRVFVDPLTQFRYLSPDDYQFREQVLSFLQFLKEEGCTVLFTSQDTVATPDDDLQFMSDGILHLGYTADQRTLEVTKLRGSDFQSGRHAVRIDGEGMTVYPQLRPGEKQVEFTAESLSLGIPEIDELLGGGFEKGTVTMLTGPSGVGKTTFGTQFVKEAAGRGIRSAIYMFEENEGTFLHRSEAVNIPVEDMLERGTLTIEEIDAANWSPDEFANRVQADVEESGTEIVMIDGIEGYQHSLNGTDEELVKELHTLCRYLHNVGVTTVLAAEVGAVTGTFEVSEHDVSYLADNIVFLRYLEVEGEMRKAIGVLKKRASDFERTLREFQITEYGISVGKPLSGLRGILQGTPEWVEPADGEKNE